MRRLIGVILAISVVPISTQASDEESAQVDEPEVFAQVTPFH